MPPWLAMHLPDDDELYEVDQTYLGPPRRYIAAMRHKAIFAWLGIGPLTLVAARNIGVPMNLLTVGLLFLATVWAAMTLADHATHEQPVANLVRVFWHDLTAPRPPTRGRVSHAERGIAALRRNHP